MARQDAHDAREALRRANARVAELEAALERMTRLAKLEGR
jgi:hypothetical protein